ncbi:MAG: DNA-directed RNA polymerase subunit delta, partial [Erysipelotrichaceae bacterium]|nr:DNA-directed RNA polymerase subunit delta [Erysipelotrichaceae bacterium]
MSVKTIDVAYDYLKTQNHSISFRDLWKKVVDEMGYDEAQAKKKISQFYTDLSLDSRFTPLQNNV